VGIPVTLPSPQPPSVVQDTSRAVAVLCYVLLLCCAPPASPCLFQPLHCAFASDYGGNSITGTFLGQSVNLHHTWDYNILNVRLRGPPDLLACVGVLVVRICPHPHCAPWPRSPFSHWCWVLVHGRGIGVCTCLCGVVDWQNRISLDFNNDQVRTLSHCCIAHAHTDLPPLCEPLSCTWCSCWVVACVSQRRGSE
jgi:hypothetical protein